MVEFRLYYDDNGNVLCYSCDKPEGNYIVIDAQTYAECRFDIKVIDGKIIKKTAYTISKLIQSDTGTRCVKDDCTIVVDTTYNGDTICWTLKTYEYKD